MLIFNEYGVTYFTPVLHFKPSVFGNSLGIFDKLSQKLNTLKINISFIL